MPATVTKKPRAPSYPVMRHGCAHRDEHARPEDERERQYTNEELASRHRRHHLEITQRNPVLLSLNEGPYPRCAKNTPARVLSPQ